MVGHCVIDLPHEEFPPSLLPVNNSEISLVISDNRQEMSLRRSVWEFLIHPLLEMVFSKIISWKPASPSWVSLVLVSKGGFQCHMMITVLFLSIFQFELLGITLTRFKFRHFVTGFKKRVSPVVCVCLCLCAQTATSDNKTPIFAL